MKIIFITPAIGKKKGKPYIGTWKMEPLTIAHLKALTPKNIETVFYDDRIELINYEQKADLVLISVETYNAKRSYEIAKNFQNRGVKVALGGYHVTLLPEEARKFADSILIGNAENIWLEMLEDVKKNALKIEYRGTTGYLPIEVDKSIFYGKKYLSVSLVETGRGCCNLCDFCAIAGYYGGKYHARPHEDIIADIKNSRHKYHFLVDDNMMADKAHTLVLLKKIKELNIKWAGQGTLNMAKDIELLNAMKESGCVLILIGFESLDENTLKKMNKSINIMEEERDKLVQKIHDAGIGIYATFVFGYDNDTEKTVQNALEFSKKHNFYIAAFNHLLPFPGTKLYKRLEDNKQLIYDKWWLSDTYHYGEVAFHPKNMSAEELSRLCRNARKDFSSFKSILRRGFASMLRTSIFMSGLFWMSNLRLGEEIDQKMYIPIGKNLDEMPK